MRQVSILGIVGGALAGLLNLSPGLLEVGTEGRGVFSFLSPKRKGLEGQSPDATHYHKLGERQRLYGTKEPSPGAWRGRFSKIVSQRPGPATTLEGRPSSPPSVA